MASETNRNPILHDQFDCGHIFSFGCGGDDSPLGGGYVDVKLARPVYTTGSLVAASIHCTHPVLVTGVGFVRLDPRWHKKQSSALHVLESHGGKGLPAAAVPPGNQIFWQTDTALCEAVERPEGPPYQPPPIVLPNFPPPAATTTSTTTTPERLAIVRLQLPTAGPPTLTANSCRYYYALLVQVEGTNHVFQVPIPVVLTAVATEPIDTTFPSTPITVHITNTKQMLTPTEREEVPGEWSVVAAPPTGGRPPPTLLLTDQGVTLCRLVFVSGFTLTPGSIFRCHIIRMDPSCCQISGHLMGRETCVQQQSQGTSKNSTTTTRMYSWDTTNQSLDYVETCCLSLCLPNDHSVPRNTLEIRGVVTIRATVELDVTVRVVTTTSQQQQQQRRPQFRTVHAEIPCHIVSPVEDYEQDQGDDNEDYRTTTTREPPYAVRDLKVLGLAAIPAS